MQINEFSGIASFHDGQTVSDYCNMMPIEKSVVDRLGCDVLFKNNSGERVVSTFVDSLNNIYVATELRVRRFSLRNGKIVELELKNNTFVNNKTDNITFCESSTKPSQVYMCDGRYVYYWNTTELASAHIQSVPEEYRERCESYRLFMLPIADFEINPSLMDDKTLEYGETGIRYGFFPNVYNFETKTFNNVSYTKYKPYNISSITWFDNRLVCTQSDKNTVWITQVDPSRWLVPVFHEQLNACLPYNVYQRLADGSVVYTLIPNYYSSTASNASLVDVVAFSGQLYFLNNNTIEVWSATGNNENPIQHNTMNTLYYGGRSPCIISDVMYLICKDQIGNDFIAAVQSNGQIQQVSNNEIDKLLMPRAYKIKPLSSRDISLCVVYTNSDMTEGFVVTKDKKWWRYHNSDSINNEFTVWTICSLDGKILDVTNNASICEQVNTNRNHADGRPILRCVRGFFTQTVMRTILRSVEVICDTGVKFKSEQSGSCYLRVSFDRGLSFGPYLYRRFGLNGTNDKTIIWRNCGSGNSTLLEFGTSDNVRFQIYAISIERS